MRISISLIFLLLITTQSFASIAKFSAVRGEVTVIDAKLQEHGVKTGDAIDVNSTIQTAHNAKAQLIFNDKTIITIGKDSNFKVNEYVFNQKKMQMRVKMHFKKGFFKTITGKIGHIAPKSFTMSTVNSTIGFRGTHVLMKLTEVREIIACTQGAIEVRTMGQHINVGQEQFITIQTSQHKASKPQTLTPSLQQTIINEGFKADPASKKDQEQGNDKGSNKASEQLNERNDLNDLVNDLDSDITQEVLLETQIDPDLLPEPLPFSVDLGTNTQTPIDLFQ